MTYKVIGNEACVDFGEFPEFDASEGRELVIISNCNEGFELS